jgi:hypothetical protein
VKVFFIPLSKIYYEINKLTGCMAPIIKISNFDQGFYNLSLVLNEILGQSKFSCSGAAQQIKAARDKRKSGASIQPIHKVKAITTIVFFPWGKKKRLYKKV